MNIDSVVMSWNPEKNQYTITILTESSGLIAEQAKDIREAINIINKLEEKYAT